MGFGAFHPFVPLSTYLAKAISLAVLSTISADLIVLIGMGGAVHLVRLSFSVFLGAVVFNLIGLMIASYARSVNHYMLIVCLPHGLPINASGADGIWNNPSAIGTFSPDGIMAYDCRHYRRDEKCQ